MRRRLLALPPGLSLLDLGAGAGYLGASVRGHFGHLSGLESDPEAASADTAKLYDRWITAALTPEFSPGRLFDVIVCADVLEHLANPEEILAMLRGWLAPEGRLLVSLPNVANLTVRLALLAGRFRYAERGILDRTHLRFYTRATARSLLEASGFRIDRVTPTAMPVELAVAWLGRVPVRPAVRGLALAAARTWPTLFGYQFVFEARAA